LQFKEGNTFGTGKLEDSFFTDAQKFGERKLKVRRSKVFNCFNVFIVIVEFVDFFFL